MISLVTPSSGQVGTTVSINGVGLRGGANQVTEILLAGQAVQNITSQTDVLVVAVAQTGSGNGIVSVISDSGSVVTGQLWTYTGPQYNY